MATRAKKKTEAPPPEEDDMPPAGHNGADDALDEADFLAAVNEILAENAKVQAAQSARKVVRKKWKGLGIELGHLDAVVRLAEWNRDELREHFAIQRRYAAWMKLDVGYQGALFGDAATPTPKTDPFEDDGERYYRQGYTTGLLGKGFGTPPDTCPPSHHQDWLRGWSEAQAKIGSAIKTNTLAKPAPVVTDEDDDEGEGEEDVEIPGFLRRLAGPVADDEETAEGRSEPFGDEATE